MKIKAVTIALFCTLIACQEAPIPPTIQDEIAELTTSALQEKYLETIYDEDQRIRDHTKEYTYQELKSVDSINLLKVMAYLDKYGYPQQKDMSDKAVRTPELVLHHYGGENRLELKSKYLEMIVEANKKGDLEDISFFLNRMYSDKYGERLEMQSPFTLQDEMDTLLVRLRR